MPGPPRCGGMDVAAQLPAWATKPRAFRLGVRALVGNQTLGIGLPGHRQCGLGEDSRPPSELENEPPLAVNPGSAHLPAASRRERNTLAEVVSSRPGGGVREGSQRPRSPRSGSGGGRVELTRSIARRLGRTGRSIRRLFEDAGGVRPAPRRRAERHLSLTEREEISRGVAAGESLRVIASRLGRAPSTVSRELARNGATTGIGPTSRPGGVATGSPARPCRLATNPALHARRLRTS